MQSSWKLHFPKHPDPLKDPKHGAIFRGFHCMTKPRGVPFSNYTSLTPILARKCSPYMVKSLKQAASETRRLQVSPKSLRIIDLVRAGKLLYTLREPHFYCSNPMPYALHLIPCRQPSNPKKKWWFPKIRGIILRVPIIRIVIFWGLYWSRLILGNYQICINPNPKP